MDQWLVHMSFPRNSYGLMALKVLWKFQSWPVLVHRVLLPASFHSLPSLSSFSFSCLPSLHPSPPSTPPLPGPLPRPLPSLRFSSFLCFDPEVLQIGFGVNFLIWSGEFMKIAGEFLSEFWWRFLSRIFQPLFPGFPSPRKSTPKNFTPKISGIPLHYRLLEPKNCSRRFSAYRGTNLFLFVLPIYAGVYCKRSFRCDFSGGGLSHRGQEQRHHIGSARDAAWNEQEQMSPWIALKTKPPMWFSRRLGEQPQPCLRVEEQLSPSYVDPPFAQYFPKFGAFSFQSFFGENARKWPPNP